MRPWLYNILYRLGIAPWDTGVRPHLVDLLDSGRLKPETGSRVLDLGCGTGSESVHRGSPWNGPGPARRRRHSRAGAGSSTATSAPTRSPGSTAPST
jgi:hypothetical protein